MLSVEGVRCLMRAAGVQDNRVGWDVQFLLPAGQTDLPSSDGVRREGFLLDWGLLASFQIPTFMYLWAIYIFPGSVCLFGCIKIGWPMLGIYKLLTDTWMWKLGDRTFIYNCVLEITRPHRFISGNTWIGTRPLYWILTGPSFAVQDPLHYFSVAKWRNFAHNPFAERTILFCGQWLRER